MQELLSLIQEELQLRANQKRAVEMRAYMRNKFDFFGVPQPVRKKISHEFVLHSKLLEKQVFVSLIQALWELPQREYKYLAMDMLERNVKKLHRTDLPWLVALVEKDTWWDTLDKLASNVIGMVLYDAEKSVVENYATQWMQSNNFWINRISIIFQLKYKEKTHIDLLEKAILTHNNSTEFFIQKAIGWALRQYARTNANYVVNFVRNYPLKPLSQREALKRIV